MSKLKRGKMSQQERELIASQHDTKSVEEIARQLNRSQDFVRKAIAALPTVERAEEQGDWISRLRVSSFWAEIRKGLMGSEVGYFEKAWASYNDQFGSATDILATDELMIKDLVMLDIFSNRCMIEQANVIRRIEDLERRIEREEEKDFDAQDTVSLGSWRTQHSSLLAAKVTLSKQHMEYQQRKDAKLRDLKGSRDQRFKQIEESRRNIFELIKDLDKRKKRQQEGILAGKVKEAANRVRQDWNQLHEFEDGEVDKPFLSPEGELEDERLQNEQGQADRREDT